LRRRRPVRSDQHTQEPGQQTDCKARARHRGREFKHSPQDRVGTGGRELGLVGLEVTQDRAVRPRVRRGGDWWSGVLLTAGQREVASFGLTEPGVLPFGLDLPQNRCIKRGLWRRTTWARPQAFDLHGFDHRLTIHGVLRFAQNNDRGFNLAGLLGGLRFLGVAFGHSRVLGCPLGWLCLGRLLRVTCGRGGLGGFGLGRHRLVSRCSYGMAAIIRPGEPPPSDARRRFGVSPRSPRRVWCRSPVVGLRRCRAPHRRLRRRRLPGRLRWRHC
jgi:hypothetical protein